MNGQEKLRQNVGNFYSAEKVNAATTN